MQQRDIQYQCDGVKLLGAAFLPDGEGLRPGVLVAHDWSGRGPRALEHARRLAERGYVGFALDMYGDARVGSSIPENVELMQPLQSDRALLMRRMQAALAALQALPEVDMARTAAIGFCFGGMCVLDLARSGAQLRGVVSFHGLLSPPPAALCKPMVAKVLALHGYRDPMGPPEHVVAFGNELTAAAVDWQLHAYGTAVHAFTNPDASDPKSMAFEQRASDRAFRAMQGFFDELF